MKKNCGKFLTRAITNVFHKSPYYPKTAKIRLSEGIQSDLVSPKEENHLEMFSRFMYLECMLHLTTLTQLADGTAVYADKTDSLKKKLHCLSKYSNAKYQVPNIKNTIGIFLTIHRINLCINHNLFIDSVNYKRLQISWHGIFPNKRY